MKIYKILILLVCLGLAGCGREKGKDNQPQPTNSAAINTNKLATFVNRKPRTNINIQVSGIQKSTNIVTKRAAGEPGLTQNISTNSPRQASVNLPQPQQVPTTPPIDYAAEKIEDLKIRASNGDTSAQMELASRLLYGRGVEKDEAQAIQWLAMAAEAGNAIAQNRLGIMYASGQGGLQKDPTQAVYWYKMAAENNFATAQNNLGIMYAQGNGVEKDDIEAYKWLTLAGQKITNAIMFRRSIEQRMTPQQIEEANKRVAEFLSNQIQGQNR